MRAAVRYLNRPPQWAGEDAWRRQLSRLPTATALVAGRLLELDRPAAADDPELAERTGLGAIALRRHLRALEQAGLARRYAPRASNNPGRPRHVYEADIAEER